MSRISLAVLLLPFILTAPRASSVILRYFLIFSSEISFFILHPHIMVQKLLGIPGIFAKIVPRKSNYFFIWHLFSPEIILLNYPFYPHVHGKCLIMPQ